MGKHGLTMGLLGLGIAILAAACGGGGGGGSGPGSTPASVAGIVVVHEDVARRDPTALGVTRPGATARDLTRAAEAVAGRRTWLTHLYLAHGTGTESAEPPFVGTDLGDEFDESVVLAPGMVLVLEPAIWDDGRGGFRAEQIVTVTEDGWRSLSELTWDGWT